MTDCIFCKIVEKDISSYPVYEDDIVYAFLDITQTTKGHTLVIPKKHVTDVFEYEEKLAGDVFARIPKIARAIEQAFPDMVGLNIINNNKEAAYQSVFHSHIHLIPRYGKDDDFSMTFADNGQNYSTDDMVAIAQAINEEI
ncbi:HIT family protein [Vagococcus sp. JNUCC 83]